MEMAYHVTIPIFLHWYRTLCEAVCGFGRKFHKCQAISLNYELGHDESENCGVLTGNMFVALDNSPTSSQAKPPHDRTSSHGKEETISISPAHTLLSCSTHNLSIQPYLLFDNPSITEDLKK